VNEGGSEVLGGSGGSEKAGQTWNGKGAVANTGSGGGGSTNSASTSQASTGTGSAGIVLIRYVVA